MKKYFNLLVLAAMFVSLPACKEDEPDKPAPPKAPETMTVDKTSVSSGADGTSVLITFTAPSKPAAVSSADWLTYEMGPFNSDTYKGKITLNVAKNTTYEPRNATLTLSSKGVQDVKVSVSQDAAVKPDEPLEPVDNPAFGLFGLGWNMGNHFDAFYNGTWAGDKYNYPDETCWGASPATQATFDGVKKAGFKSVRIPITWLNMIGPGPEYKIDETWMNRIYEVVGFAEKAGLVAIINTHHDENNNDDHWLDIKTASRSAADNEIIKTKIAAVWTQIAEKFKDKGDFLVMESFNEIQDGGWGNSAEFKKDPSKQCDVLNDWNQVFVDAVRATGGNNATRWLGVPTYAAGTAWVDYFRLPSDPAGKTMMAVHCYDPYEYTLGDSQYSDWGHTGASGKKATWGDEKYIKDLFYKLNSQFVAKGIPVYLGEFGCSMRSKSDTRAWAFYKYYMEYVAKAAGTYKLPGLLWDNGSKTTGKECHGYIDHGTGGYMGDSEEIVKLLVKGMLSEDPSYTLESVYNKAPKFN
ncbi:MAG: cellulase family glycosylhydrolase [Bacteroidales bacterium]|nr:cellulase family glycosylhydrolase [Bacteroidales bacterium]